MEGALDDTRKGAWTVGEDEALCQAVLQHGTKNWTVIAAGIAGRSGKSCRLRWCNHLDPAVNKEPFSEWEAAVIIRAQAIHNNRWAAISRLLQGRTDNAVKNHWHATLSRKVASGALRNRFLDEGVTLEWLLDNPEPGKASPDAKALLAAARKAARGVAAAGDTSPRGPASSSTCTGAPGGPVRSPAAPELRIASGPRSASISGGKWKATLTPSPALNKKKRSRRQAKHPSHLAVASPLATCEESNTPTSVPGISFEVHSTPMPSMCLGAHAPAALEDAGHMEGTTVVVEHVITQPQHVPMQLHSPQDSPAPCDVFTTRLDACNARGGMASNPLEEQEAAVSRSSDDSSCGAVLLPVCGQHGDAFAALELQARAGEFISTMPHAMVRAGGEGSPRAMAVPLSVHCTSGSESSSPMVGLRALASQTVGTRPTAATLLVPSPAPGPQPLQPQERGSGPSSPRPVCDGVSLCPAAEPSMIHCQHSMVSSCASLERHVAQQWAGSSVCECCPPVVSPPQNAGGLASPTLVQCAATKPGGNGAMLRPPAHVHPSAEHAGAAGDGEQMAVTSEEEEEEVEPSCRYLSLFNVELCSEARLARTVTTGSLSPTGSLRTWSGAHLEELTHRLGANMEANHMLGCVAGVGMSRCASVPVIAMADPSYCTFYASHGPPFASSGMTRALSCADMSIAAAREQARCMVPVGRSLPASPQRSLHVRYAPYPKRSSPLSQGGPPSSRYTPQPALLPCSFPSSPHAACSRSPPGLPMQANASFPTNTLLHGCALRCRSLPSLAPLAEGAMLSAGLSLSAMLPPAASLPLLGQSTYGPAAVVESPIMACDTGLCPMPCDAPAPLNGTTSSALDALEAPSMDALAQMEAILLPEDVERDLLFL